MTGNRKLVRLNVKRVDTGSAKANLDIADGETVGRRVGVSRSQSPVRIEIEAGHHVDVHSANNRVDVVGRDRKRSSIHQEAVRRAQPVNRERQRRCVVRQVDRVHAEATGKQAGEGEPVVDRQRVVASATVGRRRLVVGHVEAIPPGVSGEDLEAVQRECLTTSCVSRSRRAIERKRRVGVETGDLLTSCRRCRDRVDSGKRVDGRFRTRETVRSNNRGQLHAPGTRVIGQVKRVRPRSTDDSTNRQRVIDREGIRPGSTKQRFHTAEGECYVQIAGVARTGYLERRTSRVADQCVVARRADDALNVVQQSRVNDPSQ